MEEGVDVLMLPLPQTGRALPVEKDCAPSFPTFVFVLEGSLDLLPRLRSGRGHRLPSEEVSVVWVRSKCKYKRKATDIIESFRALDEMPHACCMG